MHFVTSGNEQITAIAEQLAIRGEIGGRKRLAVAEFVRIQEPTTSGALNSHESSYGIRDARQQTVGMFGQIGECEATFTFWCIAQAAREQPRQPAVCRPIGGPEHDRRRIERRDLRADQQL